MPTRTIKGDLDRLTISSGNTEITYLGPTASGNPGDLTRAFRVNPSTTGDILVSIDNSSSLLNLEIFQEDNYTAGSAPTGYFKFYDVVKAGKSKGAVGVTVTDASKNYVVLLHFDGYSSASYTGSVVVP
jgi:hypothetical protein